MSKLKEKTILLQRHLLGSISFEDIQDEEESEQDRKDYCSAIFAIYPRLEKKLKKLLLTQLMFSSNEADTWEKVILGRGTTNGLALLLEEIEKANSEHIANNKQKDEFDKASPIAEL